jgi:hypothetical protein
VDTALSLDGWDMKRFDDLEWGPWGSTGDARAKILGNADGYAAAAGSTHTDFETEDGATYIVIFKI